MRQQLPSAPWCRAGWGHLQFYLSSVTEITSGHEQPPHSPSFIFSSLLCSPGFKAWESPRPAPLWGAPGTGASPKLAAIPARSLTRERSGC
uniref:Uncharacterized protein n=1 Tax=Chelonoidis abingdonii TaxID=106734 RepID=A0A8C0G7Y0_CHEAB